MPQPIRVLQWHFFQDFISTKINQIWILHCTSYVLPLFTSQSVSSLFTFRNPANACSLLMCKIDIQYFFVIGVLWGWLGKFAMLRRIQRVMRAVQKSTRDIQPGHRRLRQHLFVCVFRDTYGVLQSPWRADRWRSNFTPLSIPLITLGRCWVNVGPPSQTVAQHSPNIASMSHVCWNKSLGDQPP